MPARSFICTTWLGAALLLGLALPAPSPAAAQEVRSQDDPYVAIKLALGVGGSTGLETSAAGLTVSGKDDLEPSIGLAGAYMHPLHRYFVLGGQLGFLSWQTQSGDNANLNRNWLLDLTLVPAGRLPLTDDIELSLGIPVGLAVDFWGDDRISAGVGGINVVAGDVGTGLGFTIGVMLGARFALSKSIGLVVELGYVAHDFSHTVDTTVAGLATVSTDVTFTPGQPTLMAGVSF